MTARTVGVIDIGKSNAKVAVVDLDSRTEIAVRKRPNTVLRDGKYPHFDIDGLWAFALGALRELNAEFPFDAISVTTHGASAALIAADGLHSVVRRAVGISRVAGSPRRYGLRWHYQVPAWSEYVEVHWSQWGEAYVTPVEPGLGGVAILSSHRPQLDWFPSLAAHLADAQRGPARGCGPMRQLVSRRVAGRVLLVGDAAGYEDALTGEGVSLAVKQAAAAVAAIVDDNPSSYEHAWHSITRRYRLLTRGLVLASAWQPARRAVVPACCALPAVFDRAVHLLAH